jgi:hypothetical protein
MFWMAKELESDGQQGQEIVLSTLSSSTLRFTPSPIQWLQGDLSAGEKQLRHEAVHLPPSTAAVKNTWIYTFTFKYMVPHSAEN